MPLSPPAPSEVLPSLITAVSEGAHNGQVLHDLDPTAKDLLARLGYVTTSTENPTLPTSYSSYHAEQNRERMLARLAENSEQAMAGMPHYGWAIDEGTLGLAMARTLTTARATRHHAVHLERERRDRQGKVTDGVVTADATTTSMPDEHSGTMLHTIFQGMLRTEDPQHVVDPRAPSCDWEPPADPWGAAWIPPEERLHETDAAADVASDGPAAEPKPRPALVEVTGLNEYRVRAVGEGVGTLVVRELRNIKVRLPSAKVPLNDWLTAGETFHPEIQAWLRAIDLTYNKSHENNFVQADYPGHPDDAPTRRDYIIGTDAAPVLKLWRDGLNGLVHHYRGDSRFNQEQDPIRRHRLPIEKGVGLKRPSPPKPGEDYYSPSLARPLNPYERTILAVQETWEDVRTRPRSRMPELLGAAAGKVLGGVGDLLISAGVLLAKSAGAIGKGIKHHWEDAHGYRQQRQQARERLGVIAAELNTLQQQIAAGDRPDMFPESTLEPGPQLDLIKRMTSVMMERLVAES